MLLQQGNSEVSGVVTLAFLPVVLLSPTTTRHSPPAVTLHTVTSLMCTDDVMAIHVNLTQLKWLYNDTNPDLMSLLNESCTGRAIGDTWSLNNPHTRCNTLRQIDGDFVQYSNALLYKEVGNGPIVRQHRWRLDLTCRLRRQSNVNTGYTVEKPQHYQVSLQSQYQTNIHVYNDSSLRSKLPLQQFQVHLGQDVYVEVEVTDKSNVTMEVETCVAKPQSQASLSYTLIEHGCPTDSQTFVVYREAHRTLFRFKAFEFYSGVSSVYIDCRLLYCAPDDTTPPCNLRCL